FEVQDTTAVQASSGAYGLYRSDNGGASFNRVAALPGPGSSLVADPTNPARVYAAVTMPLAGTRDQTSGYVTANAGETWTQVFTQANSNGTISNAQQTVLTLAAGPNRSVAVAISAMNNSGTQGTLNGVFLSQDFGLTWHQLSAPLSQVVPGNMTPVNLTLAIDPNNANIVYLAGDRNDNAPFFAPAFRLQFNPANNTSTSTSL